MWGAEAVLTIVQGRGWRGGDVSPEENLDPVLGVGVGGVDVRK